MSFTLHELYASQVKGVSFARIDSEASFGQIARNVIAEPRRLQRDLSLQRAMQARSRDGIDGRLPVKSQQDLEDGGRNTFASR